MSGSSCVAVLHLICLSRLPLNRPDAEHHCAIAFFTHTFSLSLPSVLHKRTAVQVMAVFTLKAFSLMNRSK